jgi:hypothetical protein
MTTRNLTPADTNWHDKIRDLEAILEQLRPELIEAEAMPGRADQRPQRL